MKEIVGDLWDYAEKPQYYICITTNGTVKGNGCAVMGRGCAYEAMIRYPGLDKELGLAILRHGNIVQFLRTSTPESLITFPVKHEWHQQADINLIKKSANELAVIANALNNIEYILPRPGCGNGKLSWEVVKPVISFLPDNVHIITWA